MTMNTQAPVSEQIDIAPIVDVPVVLMGGGILAGDEDQVGVQPGHPSVPVRGNGWTRTPSAWVAMPSSWAVQSFVLTQRYRMLSMVVFQFDSDLLRRHADIDLA